MVMSNDNNEQEVNETRDIESDETTKKTEGRKKKVDRTKVKGKVEDDKEEEVVRLFSVNFNGFGPCSESKMNQIADSSKLRKIDGLLTSSSNVWWNRRNENRMTHSLKIQTRMSH